MVVFCSMKEGMLSPASPGVGKSTELALFFCLEGIIRDTARLMYCCAYVDREWVTTEVQARCKLEGERVREREDENNKNPLK